MGIIFRNGIPYGATESDVTSVAQYADLFDLDEKKVDHLYIVEETSKPYRYDRDTDNFIILAEIPTINSQLNQVIVGNGHSWAKGGAFKAELVDIKTSTDPDPEEYDTWNIITGTTSGSTASNTTKGIIYQGDTRKTYKNPCYNTVEDGKYKNFSYSFESNLPYLALRDESYALFNKGSYLKIDDAEVMIAEKAQVIIDGNGTEKKIYWEYNKQDPNYIKGPFISIHSPVMMSIEEGRITDCASEIHCSGVYSINIVDDITSNPGYRRKNVTNPAELTQKHGINTFMSSFYQSNPVFNNACPDGPLIKFSGNPTAMFKNTSWVDISDSAVLLMSGQGAIQVKDQATVDIFGTADLRMGENSQLFLEQNCTIHCSANYAIDMGTYDGSSVFITSNPDPTAAAGEIRSKGGNNGRESNVVSACGNGSSGISSGLSEFDYGVNVWLHNNGSLSYGTREGTVTTKIGGRGNSFYLIEPGGGNSYVKFAPEGQFNFKLVGNANYSETINPTGSYTKLIQPKGYFDFLMQSPNSSAYQKYIIEPTYSFMQVEGLTHIEDHNGTVIFRDNYTTDAPLFARGEVITSAEIETVHEYTNAVIEDLKDYSTGSKTDYQIFQTKVNPSSAIGYTESTGKVTSIPKYTAIYATSINYQDTGVTITFVQNNSYNPSTTSGKNSIFNSTGFLNALKNKYSNNISSASSVVANRSDLVYERGSYISGQGYPFTVSNINISYTYSVYLFNQYAVGTTGDQFATGDRDIINNAENKIAGSTALRALNVVTSSELRSDMRYITTITGFNVQSGGDRGKDWTAPIQSIANGGPTYSPILQMYDRSNFLMRAREIPYSNTTLQHIFYTSTLYDATSQETLKESFEADTVNYQNFQDLLPATWNIKYYTVAQNTSSTAQGYKTTISYFLIRDEQYNVLQSDPENPTFEMVGNSELRLHNGAKITAETDDNHITTITFAGHPSETPVSFTLSELAALKARLSDSRVIELTQEEYDELDPPNPNTLYLVVKGNTVIQYLGNVKIGSGVAGGNTIIKTNGGIAIAGNMTEVTQ